MIDISNSQCVDEETIGIGFLTVLEKFFEDEKNQADYQKWLKTRSKEEIAQWCGVAS